MSDAPIRMGTLFTYQGAAYVVWVTPRFGCVDGLPIEGAVQKCITLYHYQAAPLVTGHNLDALWPRLEELHAYMLRKTHGMRPLAECIAIAKGQKEATPQTPRSKQAAHVAPAVDLSEAFF